jgi:hypothetical protein
MSQHSFVDAAERQRQMAAQMKYVDFCNFKEE